MEQRRDLASNTYCFGKSFRYRSRFSWLLSPVFSLERDGKRMLFAVASCFAAAAAAVLYRPCPLVFAPLCFAAALLLLLLPYSSPLVPVGRFAELLLLLLLVSLACARRFVCLLR